MLETKTENSSNENLISTIQSHAEWHVYQRHPLVLSWESQCDYSCISANRSLQCSPPTLILLQFSDVTTYFYVHSLWEWRHSKNSSYYWRITMGSINKKISRKRDWYVRSLKSDKYPCNSSKGTSFCQYSYLVLTGLWCHWCHRLWFSCNLFSFQIQVSMALIGMVRKSSVDPRVLAKWWGITPEKVQKTIQATAQRRIRTILLLFWSGWSRTNVKNLSYHHLAHPVFSDMTFASTVSKRGNRCAQIYVTDFGWARFFQLAFRSEIYQTLSLLCALDGVPPACIYDNTKEMIQGNTRSSKMLLVSWNSWKYILPGQALSKERLKSKRNGLMVSCWEQKPQNTCEMTT